MSEKAVLTTLLQISMQILGILGSHIPPFSFYDRTISFLNYVAAYWWNYKIFGQETYPILKKHFPDFDIHVRQKI